MNETRLLTDEEKGTFREWDKLFESEGWRQLTKEIEAELEHLPLQAFTNAKDFGELVAYRVRARVIAELLSYPQIIAQRKDQLLYEREQAAIDAKESRATEDL